MFLRKLALQNFRNFTNQHWDFAKTTIFVGENGSGKTSIIEAINLLASGDSFRAARIEEMIRLEAELSRVQALFELESLDDLLSTNNLQNLENKQNDLENLKLEAMLTRGMVAGKKSQYRLFTVNDVRRRRKDFVKNLSVVVFRPEDLRLIEGNPRRRRLFLDQTLSML
ncbi:MAG: AAA family ATPase, partial [Patescibacteria group bacterium]